VTFSAGTDSQAAMAKLDPRLQSIAAHINSRVHADIGSDHAYLLRALLDARRIEHGIAIEKSPGPFFNSRSTLAGRDADVRLTDGLAGLRPGEADSVSLSGMGGELICRILRAHPERVPDAVILQPNDHQDAVRRWGRESDFHLIDEHLVHQRATYVTLVFQRTTPCPDPAYDGLHPVDAMLFGPHLIRRCDPALLEFLHREHRRLGQHDRLAPDSQQRLESVRRLLRRFGQAIR